MVAEYHADRRNFRKLTHCIPCDGEIFLSSRNKIARDENDIGIFTLHRLTEPYIVPAETALVKIGDMRYPYAVTHFFVPYGEYVSVFQKRIYHEYQQKKYK